MASFQMNGRLASRGRRFVVVGVVSAAFFFLLSYELQTRVGLTALSATAIAYLSIFFAAYVAQYRWAQRGRARHAVSFWRYAALQVGCACLAGLLSQLAVLLGASAAGASAVSTIATGVLALFVTVFWVFPDVKQIQP